MSRLLGRVPPDMVVCLYVDEAHGLQASAGGRNVAAASLHEGPPDDVSRPGRRLFAVFAGHTHTPDVLQPSISKRFRDGNVHYMGNLSEDESLHYVFGTLDRPARGDGRERRADDGPVRRWLPLPDRFPDWVAAEWGVRGQGAVPEIGGAIPALRPRPPPPR